MALLPIIQLGHPTLRKRATEITDFNEDLRTLARNMFDTMFEADGIGLAGPQVNVDKRIFVIDMSVLEEDLEPEAFINPEILEKEGQVTMEEGCLSIPGISAEVDRPEKLAIRSQTLDGETVEEDIDGILARVFQHELDHLDGVLFIDHLPTIQRKLLEPRLKKIRDQNALS